MNIDELTITQIHTAFREGSFTCRELVTAYLDRVQSTDGRLTAITALDAERSLRQADDVDAQLSTMTVFPPLYGIPVAVKDSFATTDLPTTGGCIGLKDTFTTIDATVVERLRSAGAIILCKTNMGEFAHSALLTESSLLGITRNPYDRQRVIPGTSGGTGAAISCNMATVGLATDTGNSIRGPATHCCLVGIRPTVGLVSTYGIIPHDLTHSVAGPLARTVQDAALLLQVIAGQDERDPVTIQKQFVRSQSLRFSQDDRNTWFDLDGLKSKRLGVFQPYITSGSGEIITLAIQAFEDMSVRGAMIVNNAAIQVDLSPYANGTGLDWCHSFTFAHALDSFIKSHMPNAPYKSLREIVAAGQYVPACKEDLQDSLDRQAEQDPPKPLADIWDSKGPSELRSALVELMDEQSLDAIVYPSYTSPARRILDERSYVGDNSFLLTAGTGLPCITVPMGFVKNDDVALPTGLSFVGRAFSEPLLIRLAYAYEQATHHRRPPGTGAAAA